jgi:hypothetical protein
LENVQLSNIYVEIPATKPDSGYEYEGPIEDMPRNVSPASIVGMPDALISNITIKNVEIIHPGGGNAMFAEVSLENLDKVPENPATYPEFSKFKELPAWGLYVRHAKGLNISNLKITAQKKDYRPAIVLDDVRESSFVGTAIKEPGNKKQRIYQHKSSGITIK